MRDIVEHHPRFKFNTHRELLGHPTTHLSSQGKLVEVTLRERPLHKPQVTGYLLEGKCPKCGRWCGEVISKDGEIGCRKCHKLIYRSQIREIDSSYRKLEQCHDRFQKLLQGEL